jgi:hypothetical protein
VPCPRLVLGDGVQQEESGGVKAGDVVLFGHVVRRPVRRVVERLVVVEYAARVAVAGGVVVVRAMGENGGREEEEEDLQEMGHIYGSLVDGRVELSFTIEKMNVQCGVVVVVWNF